MIITQKTYIFVVIIESRAALNDHRSKCICQQENSPKISLLLLLIEEDTKIHFTYRNFMSSGVFKMEGQNE